MPSTVYRPPAFYDNMLVFFFFKANNFRQSHTYITHSIDMSVSELMGWVRNVVLIKCIFGSGKPWGVGISGGRVDRPGEGMGKLVYEQPGNEVDGSCHRRRVPSK